MVLSGERALSDEKSGLGTFSEMYSLKIAPPAIAIVVAIACATTAPMATETGFLGGGGGG